MHQTGAGKEGRVCPSGIRKRSRVLALATCCAVLLTSHVRAEPIQVCDSFTVDYMSVSTEREKVGYEPFTDETSDSVFYLRSTTTRTVQSDTYEVVWPDMPVFEVSEQRDVTRVTESVWDPTNLVSSCDGWGTASMSSLHWHFGSDCGDPYPNEDSTGVGAWTDACGNVFTGTVTDICAGPSSWTTPFESYDHDSLAAASPTISATQEIRNVIESRVGGGYTNTESKCLSDEYTTDLLVDIAAYDLADGTNGLDWGEGLYVEALSSGGVTSWVGTAQAQAAHSLTSDETKGELSRVYYRVSSGVTGEVGQVYEIAWTEEFVSADGATTTRTPRVEAILGQGTSLQTQVYVIDPPAVDGSTRVVFGGTPSFSFTGVTFNVATLVPDGVSTAAANVAVSPASEERDVMWQIADVDGGGSLGCYIDPDSGIITAGEESGLIRVRAVDREFPCVYAEALLELSCGSCADCIAGSGEVRNSSIDLAIHLGALSDGTSAGSIQVKENVPGRRVYSPEALLYGASVSEIDVMRDTAGDLRQVRAPGTLADVVTMSTNAFVVHFYPPSAVGTFTNGLYETTGDPVVSWRVEDPDAATNSNHRVLVSECLPAHTNEHLFVWDANDEGWTLHEGEGLRSIACVGAWTLASNEWTETVVVKGTSQQVVSKQEVVTTVFPWGERVSREVNDPDGEAVATHYLYYGDVAESGRYGRLRAATSDDGSWVLYDYDERGRRSEIRTPWLNADFTNATDDAQVRITAYDYTPVDPADTSAGDGRSRTVIEQVAGVVVAKTFHAYITTTGTSETVHIVERCTDPGASYGASSNLRSVTTNYSSQATWPETGRVKTRVYADGRMDSYTYEEGTYTSDPNPALCSFAAGVGDAHQEVVTHGTTTLPQGIAWVTTQEKITRDARGLPVLTETFVYDGSGFQRIDWTVRQYDAAGRNTTNHFSDGTMEETVWSACCGRDSVTDRTGITTSLAYDALGRQTSRTTAGISTVAALDAIGRSTSNSTVGTNAASIVVSTNEYTVAGWQSASWTAGLGAPIIHTQYVDSANCTVRKSTFPDNGTRIEITYPDGEIKEISGTAVAPRYYDYGVESIVYDGTTLTARFTKVTTPAAAGDTNAWTKTYIDALGRTLRVEYPDGATSDSFYNGKGQLVRTEDPDGVATLFAYGEMGTREVTAVDLDGDKQISYAQDEVVKTTAAFAVETNRNIRRVTSTAWPTAGNSNDTITIGVQEQTIDGLESWSIAHGLTNHQQTVIDRSQGARTVTATAPDGTYTESLYTNGFLSAVTSYAADDQLVGQTHYGYDAFGRRHTITDARNGTTVLGLDDAGRAETVTLPPASLGASPLVITNVYNNMGRLAGVIRPEGSASNLYYASGTLEETFGAGTYPVRYTYDLQARLKTMTTWTNHASDAGQAVTTWVYDPMRGFLQKKTYADNAEAEYDYTDAGRLDTRTWERGIVASYAYGPAGRLTNVAYSASSAPSVLNTYDRLGRLRTIVDGSGSRTIEYNDAGQPTNETYTAGPLAGLSMQRAYQDGRANSVSLWSGQTQFHGIGYGYDVAGRLNSVESGAHTFGYSYHEDSPLIAAVTFTNNGVDVMSSRRGFDFLNRLTSVSDVAQATVNSYDYGYTGLARRVRIDLEGGDYWEYAYDDLGQVVSGSKKQSDGTTYPGLAFGYEFDDIGNRRTSTASGQTSAYTPNAVNQYSARSVPGAVDLIGVAATNATVTVDMGPADRLGEHFHHQATVTNETSDIYQEFTIVGVVNDVNTNGEDAVAEETRQRFVPTDPEGCTYDPDGNLTSDGRWTNNWNGENRLVRVETRDDLASSVPDVTLEFAYDSQGRRFKKSVVSNSVTNVTYFVYDGWNLIAELDDSLDPIRTYTWGLDISGSLQGAGGVGGLLAITDATDSKTLYPTFDGNGNVMALVDAADGSIDAVYEYDPFGRILRSTGPSADENPLRFSTKYHDQEAGLVYYGFRYLNPDIGRWINRDPLEEYGGISLYGFVRNTPATSFDRLGLEESALLTRLKSLWPEDGTIDDFSDGVDTIIERALQAPGGKWALYKLIEREGGFTRDVQRNMLKNYMALGGPTKDPYKMSVAEVLDAGVEFSLLDSNEFTANLRVVRMRLRPGARTRFSNSYDVPAKARLTATLGQFTVVADAKVLCARGSNGDSFAWYAKGTFTVIDRYDFNYTKSAAEDALKAYLRGDLSAGPFQGRSVQGQLKTVIMSRVGEAGQGTAFDVTSAEVHFEQRSGDRIASIVGGGS